MIGRAACRGAATIVNAIPTGRGAAFGISLETDVEVRITGDGRFRMLGPQEGLSLAKGCVAAVMARAGLEMHGVDVRIESNIPISRGLKSSSAASNAIVLAAARAAGVHLDDQAVLDIAVDESLRAGVTVTGAFDDAAACYLGGAVLTDNRERRILGRGRIDPSLSVVIHVPDRRITKDSVKGMDFRPVVPRIEEALRLALAGDYARAIETNSRACSDAMGLDEEVAERARKGGAVAAGISGTGPATVALVRMDDARRIAEDLERSFEGVVMSTSLNETHSAEVVPRLF